MQSIPQHSLEDIERGKREMESFRKDLTGKAIHEAFCKVEPDDDRDWDELPTLVNMRYDEVAEELNKQLAEDTVTIRTIYCQTCKKRLFSFDIP